MPTEYCLLGLSSVTAVCWPSAEWAAWVQAVGSVVALGLTVWIASREARRHRTAELQRRRAVEVMGGTALANAAGFAAVLSRQLQSPELSILVCLTYDPGMANEIADMLRSVPLADLHSEQVTHLTRARQSFAALQNIIQQGIAKMKANEREPGSLDLRDLAGEFVRLHEAFLASAKCLTPEDHSGMSVKSPGDKTRETVH
jgi:hypothetical protein